RSIGCGSRGRNGGRRRCECWTVWRIFRSGNRRRDCRGMGEIWKGRGGRRRGFSERRKSTGGGGRSIRRGSRRSSWYWLRVVRRGVVRRGSLSSGNSEATRNGRKRR